MRPSCSDAAWRAERTVTPTVPHGLRSTAWLRRVGNAAVAILPVAFGGLDAPDLAAQAGTTTGVIRGAVRDPAGEPVPGTLIVIRNRDTDLLTTVETGSSGTFARALLPPGAYDLTVAPSAAGFGIERIESGGRRTHGRAGQRRIAEVFNLTNADNYVDTAVGSLLFNFDGTLRSGLGDTRRGQVGLSVRF